MLVRYICEYCGNMYKSRKEALECEKKAMAMVPKFKVGEVAYNQDNYKGRVLSSEPWKKDYDKAYEHLLDKFLEFNMPIEHSVIYVLKALDPELRYAKRLQGRDDIIYSKFEKPVKPEPEDKGLLVEDEEYLSK